MWFSVNKRTHDTKIIPIVRQFFTLLSINFKFSNGFLNTNIFSILCDSFHVLSMPEEQWLCTPPVIGSRGYPLLRNAGGVELVSQVHKVDTSLRHSSMEAVHEDMKTIKKTIPRSLLPTYTHPYLFPIDLLLFNANRHSKSTIMNEW